MVANRDDEPYRDKGEEGSVSWVVGELEGFVQELIPNRAVVYVGAGVSMSSNLISWNELLQSLQQAAKKRLEHLDPVSKAYFRELTTLQRNLEIGDWLHNILDSGEFYKAVKDHVSVDRSGRPLLPSAVHHNLAKLPFSMAVTTNYDRLLGDAYKAAGVEVGKSLTWRDPQPILDALKDSEFKVIHAHGSLDDPYSIVLSGRQYARLQHSGSESIHKSSQLRFGEVFKWMLKTKTFLFLGASLRDPDLIFYLQEVKAELGDSAIKHYALLPFKEAPKKRCEILEEDLKVVAIPFGNEQLSSARNNWMTTVLADILDGLLREFAARSAMESFKRGLAKFPTSDDTGFCLDAALKALLDEAVKITASFRGDFCLPVNPVSHGSGVLRYAIHTENTDEEVKQHPDVLHHSICGIAYYQATAERGVYVKNVREEGYESSHLGHYGEVKYKAGHQDVQSEFAILVEADGARVGVLNLESDRIDAYDEEHRRVARRFAEKAGRLYAAAGERQRRAARLLPKRTEHAYGHMRTICERLWRIARNGKAGELEIALLIYYADYRSGFLISQNPIVTIFANQPARQIDTPKFSFQDESSRNKSLAARVYYDRHPSAFPDADAAVKQGKLPADSYPKQLEIHGPLIGFPVSIHGHVSGVVVSWLRRAPQDACELDGRDIELFRRASHVMANCFQFEREKGPVGDEQRFASVESVEKVLDTLAVPPQPPASCDAELSEPLLDKVGQFYRSAVGGAMVSFTELLREREEQFSRKMADWYKNCPRPTFWIAPRRCRCWIRCGDAPNGKPRFLLALQAQIDRTPTFRNLVTPSTPDIREPIGVTMQPFRRIPKGEHRGAHRGAAGDATAQRKEFIEVNLEGGMYRAESLIFDDNPHLSFLLSRVSAYPYAFQQRPRVIGRDVMSEVLEKDPSLPWLVSPLIVNSASDWSDTGSSSSPAISDDRLAGYLTFDNGWHDINKPSVADLLDGQPEVEASDQWVGFQNDLIHQAALFGSCLAQNECFKSLVFNRSDSSVF